MIDIYRNALLNDNRLLAWQPSDNYCTAAGTQKFSHSQLSSNQHLIVRVSMNVEITLKLCSNQHLIVRVSMNIQITLKLCFN